MRRKRKSNEHRKKGKLRFKAISRGKLRRGKIRNNVLNYHLIMLRIPNSCSTVHYAEEVIETGSYDPVTNQKNTIFVELEPT